MRYVFDQVPFMCTNLSFDFREQFWEHTDGRLFVMGGFLFLVKENELHVVCSDGVNLFREQVDKHKGYKFGLINKCTFPSLYHSED